MKISKKTVANIGNIKKGEMMFEHIYDETMKMCDEWGMYRIEHPDEMLSMDGRYRTWTDIGSDYQFMCEMLGRWVMETPDISFPEFFKKKTYGNMMPISKVVKFMGKTRGLKNPDAFACAMTPKIIKSVAYGGTWPQMATYINKEADKLIEMDKAQEKL